jgi:hypothetical protein
MVATRWKGLLPGSVTCDCWRAFSATSETRTPSSAAELQALRAETVIAIKSFISIAPEDEIQEISRCRVVYTTVRMEGCGSAVFMPGVVASKLVLTIRNAENSGARVRRVLQGGGLLSGVTEVRNEEGDERWAEVCGPLRPGRVAADGSSITTLPGTSSGEYKTHRPTGRHWGTRRAGASSWWARTLKATPLTSDPAVDTSVGSKEFVTDNVHWIGEYPKEKGFVTYVDALGSHLLYHGECGGRPQFLSDDLTLEPGCKSPFIIDTQGNVIRTLSSSDRFSYRGVSQNGKR